MRQAANRDVSPLRLWVCIPRADPRNGGDHEPFVRVHYLDGVYVYCDRRNLFFPVLLVFPDFARVPPGTVLDSAATNRLIIRYWYITFPIIILIAGLAIVHKNIFFHDFVDAMGRR